MILQFVTSFKHTRGSQAGRLETDPKIVALNYLKSWFFIDLLASIPIDLILLLATGSTSGASLNKLFKLLRGVKLMRILRMSRLWQRLLQKTKINPAIVRLFKLLGLLMFQWHWIGSWYAAFLVFVCFFERYFVA